MRRIHFRTLACVFIAAGLAACSSASSEKFPYPPQFVQAEQVSVHVLPAPPQPGSAQYKQSVRSMLAAQKKLTPPQIAAIKQEVTITPEMLVKPVLGDDFTPEQFPALYTLLKHAASDAWRINDNVQDYWGETRPYLADKRVRRYVEPITRPGYPSGHAVTNHVWAHILADMMPCQEVALFTRASAVAQNRVLGGAHFPHDVEAGKKLATYIYHRMLENEQFRDERDAARAELQHYLRYGTSPNPATAGAPSHFARCVPPARPPAPALH